MQDFSNDSFANAMNAHFRFAPIKIAFQPIVAAHPEKIWGYEALARGLEGQPYPAMIAGMDEPARIAFDKLATATAICEAAKLGLTKSGCKVTLNVRPTLDSASVDAAFVSRVAAYYGVSNNSLVLELTEDTKLTCQDFNRIVELHSTCGLTTAIDDFGSGYSGLNVLATCGAHVVKLDRQLVMGIDSDTRRQLIVESFARVCGKLGSLVVAEGIETEAEASTLSELGITLMQGYYFGRPTVMEASDKKPSHMCVAATPVIESWTAPFEEWATAAFTPLA